MWPAEAEKFLIEEWHTVLKSTQGVMMTKAEKVDLVLKKLNARSKENEWDLDLSTDRALEKQKVPRSRRCPDAAVGNLLRQNWQSN